jgi:hypothetical protein
VGWPHRSSICPIPVDPAVDHVRGSLAAQLVPVEYGDFECPFCLRTESVLAELRDAHAVVGSAPERAGFPRAVSIDERRVR